MCVYVCIDIRFIEEKNKPGKANRQCWGRGEGSVALKVSLIRCLSRGGGGPVRQRGGGTEKEGAGPMLASEVTLSRLLSDTVDAAETQERGIF